MAHIPVLLEEVVRYLDPKPNTNFIDATIGNGGHAEIILKKTAPNGKLLGIDWDQNAIMRLKEKFQEEVQRKRLILFCGNFANIADIARTLRFDDVAGVIADLGISSEELEESGRGFSFMKNEPLLMTYDNHPPVTALTAYKIINMFPKEKLEEIFKIYGEERYASRIANAIIAQRAHSPIRTSAELADLIVHTVPRRRKYRIHPATRIFQALRIVVNDELENLVYLIRNAYRTLHKDGRMVFISYHSLEDRIVKQEFRQLASIGAIAILTRKPIRPSITEVRKNRRARSAKLRAAQKLID